MGRAALFNNTTGFQNTAVGARSLLRRDQGFQNTAVGFEALLNMSAGSANTAVGPLAGVNVQTGSNNIFLGVGASGASTDTGTIRIGGGNKQNRTFIEGITNASGTFPTQVCINSSDQLGPC